MEMFWTILSWLAVVSCVTSVGVGCFIFVGGKADTPHTIESATDNTVFHHRPSKGTVQLNIILNGSVKDYFTFRGGDRIMVWHGSECRLYIPTSEHPLVTLSERMLADLAWACGTEVYASRTHIIYSEPTPFEWPGSFDMSAEPSHPVIATTAAKRRLIRFR